MLTTFLSVFITVAAFAPPSEGLDRVASLRTAALMCTVTRFFFNDLVKTSSIPASNKSDRARHRLLPVYSETVWHRGGSGNCVEAGLEPRLFLPFSRRSDDSDSSDSVRS